MKYYTKRYPWGSLILSIIITLSFTGILSITLSLFFNYDITGIKAVIIMLTGTMILFPIIYSKQRDIRFIELLDEKIIIEYFPNKKSPTITLPLKEIIDIHICIPLARQDMYYLINTKHQGIFQFWPDIVSVEKLKEYCQSTGIRIVEKIPSDFQTEI